MDTPHCHSTTTTHTHHNTQHTRTHNKRQLTEICPHGVITCSRVSPQATTGSYKSHERSDCQYRHEPPPAFALLKPRSPSFKSSLRPLSRSRNIDKYKDIYTDMYIDIYTYVHICSSVVFYNVTSEHGSSFVHVVLWF